MLRLGEPNVWPGVTFGSQRQIFAGCGTTGVHDLFLRAQGPAGGPFQLAQTDLGVVGPPGAGCSVWVSRMYGPASLSARRGRSSRGAALPAFMICFCERKAPLG